MPYPHRRHVVRIGATPVKAIQERPIWIVGRDFRLLGILSESNQEHVEGDVCVLVIVGGPQYRAGSHRQFTLLARHLADAGYPSLRFDYRGMGDSAGAVRTFLDAGEDIDAAITAALRESHCRKVVIWGLCDAASAALLFATQRPEVAGLVLVNPWVRSQASFATAQLKHYYGRRLFSRPFWLKLLRGGVDWRGALRELSATTRTAVAPRRAVPTQADFPQAMATGLDRFEGPVLLVLSGNDLTAREFAERTNADRRWRELLQRPSVDCRDLAPADHTFSTAAWHAWLEQQTADYLDRLRKSLKA